MVPKIIHYCWFGKGKKPASFYAYLETWKEHLPDYEIKEWNEDNFDVTCCKYVEQAYIAKKYAFVSDYARIYALNKEGGIYFDTDVEVKKSFDDLLDNQFFIGYESKDKLGTSVIGSEKDFWLLQSVLESYEGNRFLREDGSMNLMTNTALLSRIFRENGIELDNTTKRENGIAIYEYTYFSPYSSLTNKMVKSENTYSIHRFSGSWFPQYYLAERRFWKALHLRNFKILLRCVNLVKHGSIRGHFY